MKNKKTIMTFAALQILFFHLWISVFPGNQVELFLRTTSYIGVDIFFFVSAYSLSQREVDSYGKFVLSRFLNIYLKYIGFAVIAFFYAGWQIKTFIYNICGISLFTKGGGSFLWFLPAIMLVYLLLPLYEKLHQKNAVLTGVAFIIVWIAIAVAISQLTSYKALFILWNRIPIILLGFYAAKSDFVTEVLQSKKKSILAAVALLAVGETLLFFFGFREKLMFPIVDLYYLIAIPAVLGWILLLSQIPEVWITKMVGQATLEIYALQMIFGYTLANKLFRANMGPLAVNLLTAVIIVVIAVIVSQLIRVLKNFPQSKHKM